MNNFFKKLASLVAIFVSMAGYVPKNATIARTFTFGFSLIFALYLSRYQPHNSNLAIVYFALSEIFYIGFLIAVLSRNGLRLWFIGKWGEEEGYLRYEAVLGFLFIHNAISIGFIASSTPGNLFHFVNEGLLTTIVFIAFVGGFLVKIFAAQAVTIEIYYCKDMFLGRKISNFIESGPYKYFNNPMYGVGQLQAYATAIWYGSAYGLIAAIVNQALVYSFYYLVEKKFVKRTYLVATPQ